MKKSWIFLILALIMLALFFTGCSIPNYFSSKQALNQGDEYFDKGSYEEALKYYDKALKANKYDAMAYGSKSAALNYLDRNEEALTSVNKAIEIAPKMYNLYLNKGDILTSLGRYSEAVESLDKFINTNNTDAEAYSKKGIALYYLGSYEDAIKEFNKAIELDSGYSDAYLWKATTYKAQENYEEALDACERGIARNKKSPEGYNIKGQILNKMERYQEALDALDKAIGLDNDFQDAYIGKLSIMYKLKNYEECISFGSQALEKFPKSEDVNWFIADAYSGIFKSMEAAYYYSQAFKINSQNEQLAIYAAWEYFYMQNYKEAEVWLNKALKINEKNSSAQSLKKELQKVKLPEAERVVDFVKNNYLYYGRIKEFDVLSNQFIGKKHITVSDIEQYINSIRIKEDMFTFVISGKEYEYITEEENINQINSYELSENVNYIRINVFTNTVGYEFKKAVDKIKDTQNKYLVIDLRGNTGGMIEASNEILDYMLPECSTSYTVDRNGYVNSYYSDALQKKFKKILIMVDHDTASSSELFALSLKKYLDNVVIVGSPTFGKGVGQNVYEDKSKKYMVFLVSFYWNVREENITGSKIYPDVKINTNKNEDYIRAIEAQIN